MVQKKAEAKRERIKRQIREQNYQKSLDSSIQLQELRNDPSVESLVRVGEMEVKNKSLSHVQSQGVLITNK